MSFAQRLRFYRKSKGWTQKKLHEKSGVAQITIRKYENNENRQPRLEQLLKIAKALDLTINQLIEGDPTSATV